MYVETRCPSKQDPHGAATLPKRASADVGDSSGRGVFARLPDGQMGYGARQYGYNGWGMAALSAHNKWASLIFMRGADLEDNERLLEGTGKKIRHVKLRSPEQFEEKRSALSRLIRAASKLNK